MPRVGVYVPVLRWKRGERWALTQLDEADRPGIVPLIELIPSLFDNPKRKTPRPASTDLVELFRSLVGTWGSRKVFVDVHHLGSDFTIAGVDVWSAIAALLHEKGDTVVPVAAFPARNHDEGALVASKELGNGIALRLNVETRTGDELVSGCREWLAGTSWPATAVDLILDATFVEEAASVRPLSASELIAIAPWRSVTLLAGSFPKDLGGMVPGRRERTRWDLAWWKEQLELTSSSGVLNFGDYTVQHAHFEEPPAGATPTASIRYASEDLWVIMRGESLRRGAKGAQYPANAQLLCEQPEYSGPDFSAGDAYIYVRANDPSRNGNPETWIRAAINRHMTLTARQLASLRDS